MILQVVLYLISSDCSTTCGYEKRFRAETFNSLNSAANELMHKLHGFPLQRTPVDQKFYMLFPGTSRGCTKSDRLDSFGAAMMGQCHVANVIANGCFWA
jgi:hypothetical protein